MTNEEKILELLEGLTSSVSGIDGRLAKLETGQAALEGRMHRIESEEKFWRVWFDKQERLQAALEGRLGRLESALAKQGEQMQKQGEQLQKVEATVVKQGELLQKVDERSQRIALLMEVEFQRKLDLLYEGHQTIMETITPKERIEEMEADISVLKMASRSHSEEIKGLKKAQ